MGFIADIIISLVKGNVKNLTGPDKIEEMRKSGDSIAKMAKYIQDHKDEFPELKNK